MRKVILLVMVLSLVIGMFAACSPRSSESPSAQESTSVATETSTSASAPTTAEKVKIGYIGWSLTDDESRGYVRLLDNAAAACGFEMQYAVYSSVEDIVTQAQTLIQAGCKGLIVLVASPELMNICEQNGVFLIQYASKVNDADVLSSLEKSKYWAGVSYTDNVGAGADIMKNMYDAGCRNVLVMAPPPGVLVHDDRVNGVQQEAAKYSDLKVTTWRASDNMGKEVGDAVANYLNTDPTIDGIIGTSGSDGAIDTIVQAIDMAGDTGKIKYATFDTADQMTAYLTEGSVYAVAGTSQQFIVFCAIALQNAVLGANWEYPIAIPGSWIWMHSIDEFNDYSKYIYGDEIFPFSNEDYQSISVATNPNAQMQDMYDMASLKTVDDFKALANN